MVLWTKERGMRNKLQIDLFSRIKAGCGKVDLGQCHTGASHGISFLNICSKHKKQLPVPRREKKITHLALHGANQPTKQHKSKIKFFPDHRIHWPLWSSFPGLSCVFCHIIKENNNPSTFPETVGKHPPVETLTEPVF